MKFLGKSSVSTILQQGLTYKENNATNNKRLKDLLVLEQKNFCAYTEKYIQPLDSVEVEHFNSSIKYNDGYYNYYAVIRSSNLYKKDEEYIGASFFTTLFFQNSQQFASRIEYVSEGFYEAIDPNDKEAEDFIDFLGLNHPTLFEQRKKTINRLKDIFTKAQYDSEKCLLHFRNYKEDLSFITAIEVELGIDLREFYS